MWLWAAKGDDTAAKDYQAAVILLHFAHNFTISLLQSRSSSTAQTGETHKSERVSRCTVFVRLNHGIFAASSSWPCAAQRAALHPLGSVALPDLLDGGALSSALFSAGILSYEQLRL